jgi:hypothetical protein
VVHDRIPRVLYEHPIVEYIPLSVTDIALGEIPAELPGGARRRRPSLLPLVDEASWRQAMQDFPFAFPPLTSLPALTFPPAGRRSLVLLALGFRVTAGIYRGRKASLLVGAIGSVCHLFTVPAKYFYKPAIDVVAYTEHGTCLAEAKAVAVEGSPGRVP